MDWQKSQTRKLTKEQVQEMREAYGQGATQGALARYFGVSIGQVGRIVRGEAWVEGAGNRAPTQAEADAILARVLLLQKQQEIAPELVREAMVRRTPPPMLLDGGDAPEEGAGTQALQDRAKAYGADIDKLLTKE